MKSSQRGYHKISEVHGRSGRLDGRKKSLSVMGGQMPLTDGSHLTSVSVRLVDYYACQNDMSGVRLVGDHGRLPYLPWFRSALSWPTGTCLPLLRLKAALRYGLEFYCNARSIEGHSEYGESRESRWYSCDALPDLFVAQDSALRMCTCTRTVYGVLPT